MPSFSKMGIFPVGYYRAISSWLLRERRDVVARVVTLEAEMKRIGVVRMKYRKIQQGESILATEQRIGFSVTAGSSLHRLVQAYIATGGNPFNISGFLRPESTTAEPLEDGNVAVSQDNPGGGVLSARSAEYNEPYYEGPKDGSDIPEQTGQEGHPGGYVGTDLGPSHRYNPARLGGRLDRGGWDSGTVNRVMHDTRKWANKEIKSRLQDKEWQILKLSDCYEQLRMERDFMLLEAFAGQLTDFPEMDEDKFDPTRLCQNVIADMYTLLFDVSDSGIPTGFKANPEIGHAVFAFEDVPEDSAGPMG